MNSALAPSLLTAYTQAMGLFFSTQRFLALTETLNRALADLRTLEARIELQTSQFRNLELEWTNAHEKLKSISGRIAKRQALDAPEPPEVPAEGGNAEDLWSGIDPISAEIHKRRERGRREP